MERWTRWIAGVAGLGVLGVALWRGVWQGLRRPAGRTTGAAARLLRLPFQLLFGALWCGLCWVLWRPLPLTLTPSGRGVALGLGAPLYAFGLALYLWGGMALGEMYRASSAFGVQLGVGHRLITHGPYAWVRHPMYLGLQLAGMGGALLYRTWTTVFVVVNFLALVFRAQQEERALALEFGEQWAAYVGRVPAWIPRFRR